MILNRTQLAWIIGNRGVMSSIGTTYADAVRRLHEACGPNDYFRISAALRRRITNALAEGMGPTGSNSTTFASLMATNFDWTTGI